MNIVHPTILSRIGHQFEDLKIARANLDPSVTRPDDQPVETTSRLAPILSIPNEILAAIFEAGLDDCEFSFRSTVRPSSFPISVSHVVHRWREVALSAPRLWTDIPISDRCTSYLSTYLLRSRSYLLTLVVDLSTTPSPGAVSKIFEQITQHAGRWHSFSIVSDSEAALDEAIEHLGPITVPLLETLQVYLRSCDGAYEVGKRIFTGGVPSLVTVRARGTRLHGFVPSWSTVTVLHLYYPGNAITNSQLLEILGALPQLTYLVLDGLKGLVFRRNNPRVRLDFLRSLIVRLTEAIFAATLQIVFAPLLESLTLIELINSDFEEILSPGYIDLFTFPALKSLSLGACSMTSSMYAHLILHFPAVEHFTMFLYGKYLSPSSPYFLTQLIVNSGSTPRWPDLTTITLSSEDISFLCSVISNRIQTGRPLLKVRLANEFFDNLDREKIDWLRENVELECVDLEDWYKVPLANWFEYNN